MDTLKRFPFFILAVLLAVLMSFDVGAGSGGMKNKKFKKKKKKLMQRETSVPYEYYEQKGLFATGLKPVFPDGIECPEISSPYGSKTRYDGSGRNNSHYNYHNGMDVTVKPGTPLLSVADGEVIHTGTAGQLVGNFIWLRYKPEATGLPYHVFARYQHLDEPSPLKVGDVVKAGDDVGPGGNTGTTGGHFGTAGYSHLHLVFFTSVSPDFMVKGPMLGPKDAMDYLDPMALYLDDKPQNISNHMLKDLPKARKKVPVPVMLVSGEKLPDDARTVWPLACRS